jgi:hypothetical protein
MAAPAVAPTPARNRRAFVRTDVSLAERAVSGFLLAVLAGIAATIWYKGQHYDAGRFVLRTEALTTTADAVEGKRGTIRQADVRPQAGQAPAQSAAAAGEGETAEGGNAGAQPVAVASSLASKGEPLELKVDGLQPMSATEFYDANNLYEKIDGRAAAYLNFNFQQLRCRSFTVTGAAGAFVDLFEYRFDTPINAFGMFALERDPKGQALAFAPDGYAGGTGCFFRQGACYVQVMASDQDPKTVALAMAVARERAKALPVDNVGLDARRRLPSTGLDPASVTFIQDSAQGQSFLKDVFQANYDFGGKKLAYFVMLTTPQQAAAAWKDYADFAGRLGGKMTPLPDVQGAKLFSAENFGTWKVIYQREGELGGVVDANDPAKARQFVEQYLEGKLP